MSQKLSEKILAALEREVRNQKTAGAISVWPSDEQRADWAFGNTVIENGSVTREMAQKAAHEIRPRRG